MANGFRLYLKYVSISLRGQLQYRASFIMSSIGHFVITFIDFLGLWALFGRFGNLKGWTLGEAALFYGIIHMAFAISEAAGRGFDTFQNQVRSGDFDRILLRPRSTALQIAGQEFQLMRIGRLAQGLMVLLWAVWALGGTWTISKAILLIASVLGGACLFTGLLVLQATMCFWTVESLEAANAITYGGVAAAQQPISIFDKWLQRLFIFIVPLACINYFPAMAILGKNDPLGSPAWLHWTSPLAGILFFVLCLQVWKIGVAHYRSTGS